jgi:vancomycin resistance protein YoaR
MSSKKKLTKSKKDAKDKVINQKSWYQLIILLILITGFVFLAMVYNLVYANEVFSGVRVVGLDLAGKSFPEAQESIQQEVDRMHNVGFAFATTEKKILLDPVVSSFNDPDLTYEIFDVDVGATVRAAYYYGRGSNLGVNLARQMAGLFSDVDIPVVYTINRKNVEEILKLNFSLLEDPARDASITFVAASPRLVDGKSGEGFDYSGAIQQLESGIARLTPGEVILEKFAQVPKITAMQAEAAFAGVSQVLSIAPLKLKFEDKIWSVARAELGDWLVFKRNQQGRVVLGISSTKAAEFFTNIADEINIEALDAKLEIQDGRVTEFQGSRDGREMDLEASLDKLEADVLLEGLSQSELVVRAMKSKIATSAVNDLGITEIIGVGKSNFAGSPPNRRHNIRVSSEKLHGLLIASGEEFSLVESLKPFTAAAGYLPELVIKGNLLIPEIGGGACQIGTTTFRAALSSGVEITQRRNHSFAVSYYNDENGLPGTDATIYDPAPDFGFHNNTGNSILIQTRIEGDELIYEFWGTNDGRQATTTIPTILSRVAAPPTKYIETTDLVPGEERCSGSNVPGYKTTFKYSVTKANGAVEKRDFDSNYRPWQRVCLVGVEELSKSEGEEEN